MNSKKLVSRITATICLLAISGVHLVNAFQDEDMCVEPNSNQKAYRNMNLTILSFNDELTTTAVKGSHSIDICQSREICVVVGKWGCVSIVDISDPNNLVELGNYTTDLNDTQMVCFIDSNHVFIGDDGRAFVLNISNPANPQVVSDLKSSFTGPLNGGCIYGNYCYGANKGVNETKGSIEIFDISDPENLTYVGSYEDADGDSPHDVKVVPSLGILVYVCKRPGDVKQIATLDISDPENPVLLDTLAHSDWQGSNQLAVNDTHCFVAINYDCAFGIADISDPCNITISGWVSIPPSPCGVWKHGDYCFTGNQFDKDGINNMSSPGCVSVIDVTDVTNPVVVNQFNHSTLYGGHQLQRYNGSLFVTAGGSGSKYLASFVSLDIEDILPLTNLPDINYWVKKTD
jgi:hypothetical protein